MIIDLQYVKSSKSSSKIHLEGKSTSAYCDNNITNVNHVTHIGILYNFVLNVNHVTSTLGSNLCSNCLIKLCKTYGGNVTSMVELNFYFSQYTGGSSFLDSIHKRLLLKESMTFKQTSTALNTFRKGHFRHGTFNGKFDEIYLGNQKR